VADVRAVRAGRVPGARLRARQPLRPSGRAHPTGSRRILRRRSREPPTTQQIGPLDRGPAITPVR